MKKFLICLTLTSCSFHGACDVRGSAYVDSVNAAYGAGAQEWNDDYEEWCENGQGVCPGELTEFDGSGYSDSVKSAEEA